MFARQWQPLGSLETKQLASEVDRGSLELAAQRLSLALEDFKPDREVEGGHIKELHKLRDDLRSPAADLSRKVRDIGAGAAGTQDSQDARGISSPSRRPWCRGLADRNPVEAVNEVVNRAFVSCGASAFYILDTYSVQETAETVARMAFTNLSNECHGIFPRDNAGPIFSPIPLIAEKTGCSGKAVCDAIGLGEVGPRCGNFLDSLRKDAMTEPGPLVADLLHRSAPLWLPDINQLPPNSSVMLAVFVTS
ncbi:hypothetical protein Purlil1_13749 [Purpureocillium lilacinum]|uniref:Uncharacterized protein n=1 Tax=Purpureocillium lilacinum TaxID=33203 RepID=A0ABR0BD85_PURLI|nr:hypothetical protein Purlil1_13749 [Purpureocillium lilacinum]